MFRPSLKGSYSYRSRLLSFLCFLEHRKFPKWNLVVQQPWWQGPALCSKLDRSLTAFVPHQLLISYQILLPEEIVGFFFLTFCTCLCILGMIKNKQTSQKYSPVPLAVILVALLMNSTSSLSLALLRDPQGFAF